MGEQGKHTEGPWDLGEVRDKSGSQVADEAFLTAGELDEDDYTEITVRGANAQTNARLIAAAPDMLAALQMQETAELDRDMDCEECCGEGEPEACGACSPPFDDARVARRAAIAKATGASNG